MINIISKGSISLKVQDFVYEISVRNNTKENISIIVEDQIPISSNTDIEITLADKGGATTDTEKGKLNWDINLKPNETKKIRFGYQMKAAKDKSLKILTINYKKKIFISLFILYL